MNVHLPVLQGSAAPEPPRQRMSASQIDKFALCFAKWGYEYLDGHVPPPHPSAQCGTRVHEILEAWLARGIPPNPDEVLVIGERVYEVGKIAIAGLHNLPAPGPHHDVEGGFVIPFFSGYPAVWQGYIDSSYVVQKHALGDGPVVYRLQDGTEVLGHVEMTPEILDHKTTTNLDYRKTPEDLTSDVQAILYAAVGLTRVPTAKTVNLRWVYYKTTKPYKSEVSYTTLTREHVMQTLALWEQLAVAGPLRAKALGLRGAQLPKNPRACSRYGGCPHKDVRCTLTRSERIDAIMSQGEDLMSMIQNAHRALTNPNQAPPPPTDATTAPLFGAPPQVPMGGLPPGPAFVGVPHMPMAGYAVAQPPAYAQPPMALQPPPQPQAVFQPPPQPPAPFQPPPPQPPAPFQPPPPQPVAMIPSVTTNWPKELRDAVVGAVRGGWNDQQILGTFGMYPGVADALTQLRKDLVTIDEYTARTSQPAAVQPLQPTEVHAVRLAIQSGATDAQICAHYPQARPHLDALRLEIQGPQRATGINAPESAGQPQLAQPAPVAPTPAKPNGNGAHDPSMTGDAYDNMDVEELRKLAKQHNIDVKGLREKNLRIQVRSEMQRLGAAPAPVALAAQPGVNMQPQLLPNIFAQAGGPPVAMQSINQAVQTHLAQPPLTGPAADAIRQALTELNKIGDVLRKLIGAD